MRAIVTVIDDNDKVISEHNVIYPKDVEISPAENLKITTFSFCIAENMDKGAWRINE